jgi:hypothetical protein
MGQYRTASRILAGNSNGDSNQFETPSSIIGAAPMYVRPFHGGFLYFLQHIVNVRNQVGLKFDLYDPNTAIAGKYIGSSGTNFSDADIKYSTLGCGYIRYINENMKLVLWYEWVKNESTSLSGFTTDKSDNVFYRPSSIPILVFHFPLRNIR